MDRLSRFWSCFAVLAVGRQWRRLSAGLGMAMVVAQFVATGWAAENRSPQDPQTAFAGAARPPSVRAIVLPHFEPDLREGPGRNEFRTVCVSCHSPRYVTLQPPFSQRQWEETVDKMAKVYGAQMDSDQRRAIIGYLAATHGPDWKPESPPADDDDFTATPAGPLAPGVEADPMLTSATDPAAQAAEVRRGADLFQQNCAGCHGPAGRGDGLVAGVLLRRPKDLTATRFSLALLSQVLWNGKPGTAMPSWRGLAPPERAVLAAFVRSLHPDGPLAPVSPEFLRIGSAVFQVNCAPCHGAAGDGNGSAARSLLPAPANFQLKQPDREYILQVLRQGIPGTGMPAWKDQIPEPERQGLADFVRSLFRAADAPDR